MEHANLHLMVQQTALIIDSLTILLEYMKVLLDTGSLDQAEDKLRTLHEAFMQKAE